MAGLKRRQSARVFREGVASNPASAAGVVVPFVQGSQPEVEEGPSFLEIEPKSQAQNLGPVTLPANGYISALYIDVETSSEGSSELEASEDFPWNIFELVKLTEPNGAPLGVELSGYQLYVANTYGVYSSTPDPRQQPSYSAEAKKPSFGLRIPIQIAPNGLGSLGNQSAAAALRLLLRVNPSSVIYKNVKTFPKINIRTYVELWGEPPATDLLGRPVQQEPMFEGTSQQWSAQNQESVSVGKNTVRMTQLGSMIRTLAFVCRNGSGLRKDAVFPNPWQIQLDNRVFRTASQRWLTTRMREQIPQLKERDTGVFVLSFSAGEQWYSGANEINSWLATLNATRLELLGSSAEAGKIDVLTNYISVTATNPEERTLQVGKSGLHPPVSETSEVAY